MYICPPPGFLQPAHKYILLQNGGQLQKEMIEGFGIMQVNLRNTCSVDNILLFLAISYHQHKEYRSALKNMKQEHGCECASKVVQFCKNYLSSENQQQAQQARFRFLSQFDQMWKDKLLIPTSSGRVYGNLENSEQDMALMLVGEIQRYRVRHYCNSTECPHPLITFFNHRVDVSSNVGKTLSLSCKIYCDLGEQ